MYLASLVAAHGPAKVSRGGLTDRPVIFMQFGALQVSCSVDDARALSKALNSAILETHPIAAEPAPADGILRGNADLVPAQHATLEMRR
jgi:hypothetical protein